MQDAIILETGNSKIDAAIIWLHGLGADGNDFAPIVPQLGVKDLNLRFIFPNAAALPVTINGGMVMPAWYDIRSADLTQDQDETGTIKSQRRIESIIHNQLESGIDANHIILVGFSQGGAIALYTGLRYKQTLAGIIALSTYLPFAQSTQQQAHKANAGTPILMAHGTQDPIVPIDAARDSRQFLQALGYKVQWQEYVMEHSVHPQEIDLIGKWIRGRIG
ncbi:MAG: alpha/beta hydrolase [Thiohalomonadales bacterium]